MPPAGFFSILVQKMQSVYVYVTVNVFSTRDKENNILSRHTICFTQMDCFLAFLVSVLYLKFSTI